MQMPPIPSRRDVIDRFREGGGRVAAVFPYNYPRELLRAFGLLPVEVWGPPSAGDGGGDTQVQAYVCSVVRLAHAFLLEGGLEVADVLVVPHTCDSLQGLGSMLLDFDQPRQLVLPIYIPRSGGAPSLRYYADELGQVYERLAELTGARPTDDELLAATRREEAADYALGELLDARTRLPLDDPDLYRLLRAREYMPAEDWEPLAQTLLAQASAPDAQAPAPVPLLVSGIVPEPRGLLRAIADAGAQVVADDFASSGRRRYPTGTRGDPLLRMAERVLGAAPDSTRGSAIASRAQHLENLAHRAGARAVLFVIVKFCEPELFYLPQVRRVLEDAGLPTTTIEVDLGAPLPAQALTRIEALVETARSARPQTPRGATP